MQAVMGREHSQPHPEKGSSDPSVTHLSRSQNVPLQQTTESQKGTLEYFHFYP